jgi:hypothetical protein
MSSEPVMRFLINKHTHEIHQIDLIKSTCETPELDSGDLPDRWEERAEIGDLVDQAEWSFCAKCVGEKARQQ